MHMRPVELRGANRKSESLQTVVVHHIVSDCCFCDVIGDVKSMGSFHQEHTTLSIGFSLIVSRLVLIVITSAEILMSQLDEFFFKATNR